MTTSHHHAIRRVATACLLVMVALSAAAADSLTPEQAKRDARILVRSMTALHPGLDKYRTPAEVNAAFDRFEARAAIATTSTDMYLAATELAASVRCGHTWTNVLNQQGAVRTQLLTAANKLPLTMSLVEGRFLVLGSADKAIATGDEIASIDGATSAQVVARMLPYLRADGSSDGKRLRQLSHDRLDYSMMDILWPLLAPPVDGAYQLTVRRRNGTLANVKVAALTFAQRDAAIARSMSSEWAFRIDGKTGVMTLPTFSLRNSKLDYKVFFADAFTQLQQEKATALVIDIRNNEGGDGAIGNELLSYLVKDPYSFLSDQSVTMYERVPYNLARYLDTWDFDFFDRTGNVDKIVVGPQAGKYRFRPNAAMTRVITPKATRFTGRAFLLVGPENSSATFSLADLAKRSKAAMLVGQQTGGNQRGLNGGQLAWVTLPASGVSVDIPLLAATYQDDTPDASVLPDLTVAPSFALRQAGTDQEMAAALKLARAAR